MTAEIGYRTELWVAADTTATTATVQLANITSITPPGLSVDSIDTTTMGGTSHVRSFIPGILDPGEMSLEMNWELGDATDALIRAMMKGRETRYMEIRFPQLADTPVFGGRGFFTGFEPGVPLDDKMTGSATVKCAGLWDEI